MKATTSIVLEPSERNELHRRVRSRSGRAEDARIARVLLLLANFGPVTSTCSTKSGARRHSSVGRRSDSSRRGWRDSIPITAVALRKSSRLEWRHEFSPGLRNIQRMDRHIGARDGSQRRTREVDLRRSISAHPTYQTFSHRPYPASFAAEQGLLSAGLHLLQAFLELSDLLGR